jgi:hypothetical protein
VYNKSSYLPIKEMGRIKELFKEYLDEFGPTIGKPEPGYRDGNGNFDHTYDGALFNADVLKTIEAARILGATAAETAQAVEILLNRYPNRIDDIREYLLSKSTPR